MKNLFKKIFTVNKINSEQVMVQCKTVVKKDAVRREVVDGVEHIVVSSYTLPDDIVMNGGLYPADEIAKSFETLELTLAPIEHPTDSDGNYISASDPRAIHNFHAGAFNMNVKREGGRVYVEKWINVQEAQKSERGKRLLDRINELETNENPRPIHTSTGVLLTPEVLETTQKNNSGHEYTWIARNMSFDHDAILLDSIGAAQPHQGVGVAVNKEGQKMKVNKFTLNAVKAATSLPLADTDARWDSSAADKRLRDEIGAEEAPNASYAKYHLWYDAENEDNFGAYKLPFADVIDGEIVAVPNALRNAAARLSQTQGPSETDKERITSIIDSYLNQLRANQMSFTDIRSAVMDALEKSAIDADFIEELYEDQAIFWSDETLFQVPFTTDQQGLVTIVGIPLPVERNVTFTPKTNQSEGDAMKELILNALAAAKVDTTGMDDAQLLQAYEGLKANLSDGEDNGEHNDIKAVVANAIGEAVKPLTDQIEGLQAKLNEREVTELTRLAGVVANSGKYPGIDEATAKTLGLDKLKEMAANCASAFGLSPMMNSESGADNKKAPEQMPQ